MYDNEKQKAKVKTLYPEADDLNISLQLEMAKDFINDRRGFIPTDTTPLEDRYLGLQVLLAVEALTKEGAEGEIIHGDNGVNRRYENGSPYSTTLTNRIIPKGTSFKS